MLSSCTIVAALMSVHVSIWNKEFKGTAQAVANLLNFGQIMLEY